MQHTLLKLIQQQFGLQINQTVLPLVEPRPLALPRSRYDTLSWGCLLVEPQSNERTRAEFLVAQLMITLALAFNKTLFSGYVFEVQPAQGLVGQCDYLLSRSPRMTDIYPPISLIIKVKRDLDRCLPHCLVEMVAAQQFNRSDAPIYGASTTGLQWQFLKLEGNRVAIEQTVYQFEPFNPVVAMLAGMLTAGDPVVETGDADVEPTD